MIDRILIRIAASRLLPMRVRTWALAKSINRRVWRALTTMNKIPYEDQ